MEQIKNKDFVADGAEAFGAVTDPAERAANLPSASFGF